MSKKSQEIVYFLHGLLSSSHYHFAGQIETWKEEKTVVPIDLPGHGHCPVDAQSCYFEAAVRYTLGVMGRFGPGHVVAASQLGGPVAVRSALRSPDLFCSLVLTGFVPDVPEQVFAGWLHGLKTHASENPKVRQWYEQMHGQRWRNTLDQFCEDAQNRYPDIFITSTVLQSLTLPILIVNGSIKSSERETALGSSRLGPGVRGHIIEGAGHIPSRDRREEFNAAVSSFWKEIPLVS